MKLFALIRRYRWDLGIALESEGHRFDSDHWTFHIIKPPKNKWYADPFILDVTDTEIIVLVEEFSYLINRGRLAKLVIDKQRYFIKKETIILDLPTHLSFPAILRVNDEVYLYPENSASGKSMLYRYNPINDTLSKVKVLCEEPLTDAIITKINNQNFLFATKIPQQNGNELLICKSDSLIGDYYHLQTLTLPGNTARSAGDCFIDGNLIIRPAQNCEGSYGSGLVFQRILLNDNGYIEVNEMFRKYPRKPYIGMHTYNHYKGYIIVDLHKRVHPHLHSLLLSIKRLVFRLKNK